MPTYCAPCGRSFQEQKDLDSHLRYSSAHKKPAQKPSRGQGSIPVKVQPITLKQQEQAISFPVKPAKPQQALTAGYPHYVKAERKHQQQPNAIASRSSAPQTMKPAVDIAPQGAGSPWSVTRESEYMVVLNALSAHCHSLEELKKHGYIVHPYNPLDYANSRKCRKCNSQEKNSAGRECTFHLCRRNKWNPNRPYKCCRTDGRGCKTLPTHDFQLPQRASKHMDFRRTPAASAEPKFRAVVLDCEMAGVAGGAGEVILLCATDYVTGAVLLNRFVCPRERITQMRSSIHGVSKATLEHAILQGRALSGWEGARAELWKYIDDSSILIGHALENDLDALRIIHPRAVDSKILSTNAVGIGNRMWGLQTLCSELLGVKIRKSKGAIHDCLEDVLATREVVLFCTQSKEALQSWAEVKQREEIRLKMDRERARQEKEKEKARIKLLKAGEKSSNHDYFDSYDEDEEILDWSDIAVDMGWPHPDTGYDPCSD